MTKAIEIPKDQHPGLPKWPGVYVTGKSVSPEQAKDIIMRTDTAVQYITEHGFGNNRTFSNMALRLSGWQQIIDAENVMHQYARDGDQVAVQLEKEKFKKRFSPVKDSWELRETWEKEMRHVSAGYVYNSWMASSYIGGPTGWCHLDGSIHVDGHNYGKWPSVAEIANDWATLVVAFPYLDLCCTLFDREHSEDGGQPVVTIVVKDGEVIVCQPDLSMHAPASTGVKRQDRKSVV